MHSLSLNMSSAQPSSSSSLSFWISFQRRLFEDKMHELDTGTRKLHLWGRGNFSINLDKASRPSMSAVDILSLCEFGGAMNETCHLRVVFLIRPHLVSTRVKGNGLLGHLGHLWVKQSGVQSFLSLDRADPEAKRPTTLWTAALLARPVRSAQSSAHIEKEK
jgi:hypothetical protein